MNSQIHDAKIFDNKIDQLLTVNQLAHKLGITPSGVYKLVYQKKLPACKVGRLLRFNWEDVLAEIRDS